MFNYKNAVKKDILLWLDANITDWDTFPTTDAWVDEIRYSEDVIKYVCGVMTCGHIEYYGDCPATETEMVESLPEIIPHITEFFNPDEFADMVNDAGIEAFNHLMRRWCFVDYVFSESFKTEIASRIQAAREKKLPRSNISQMCLYDLCRRQDWFTAGSCKQYDRMFDMVRKHAPVTEIALVIWMCSDDVSREEIEAELEKINGGN